MTLIIHNPNGKGSTHGYTAQELQREARMAAKGKGKYIGCQIEVTEGSHGTVHLVAIVEDNAGWRSNIPIAI